MKHGLPVILCLVLLVCFGCQQKVTQAPVDLESIRQELATGMQAYAQAWSNKDMEAIGTMWSHDDDITIWGPAKRDRVQGWEGPNGVKAWYETAMAGMSKVDFKINDLLIKVSQDGNAAVITYYVENDFIDMNGKPGKMTPRVTVVKVKQDGMWKQIHGDASFGIEEVQAMK